MSFLEVRIQTIWNRALCQNYRASFKSHDYRRRRSCETQHVCCDAYHLKYQPEPVKCCVLGKRHGI